MCLCRIWTLGHTLRSRIRVRIGQCCSDDAVFRGRLAQRNYENNKGSVNGLSISGQREVSERRTGQQSSMGATHHKGHKRSAREVVEQCPERVRIVEIPEAVPADYPRDTPRVHPRRPGYEDDLEMAAVNRTRNSHS